MKLNQTFTAALTAAALVAGAGFAYAQTADAPGQGMSPANPQLQATPGSTTTGTGMSGSAGSTMQAQPSSSTTMDSGATTMPGGTMTPEPRADRN